jgi:hypothetical protein
MVEKACKNCRYYHPGRPAPDGMVGWCQRLPPVMALAYEHDFQGYWPEVSGDDWCGEFAVLVTSAREE